ARRRALAAIAAIGPAADPAAVPLLRLVAEGPGSPQAALALAAITGGRRYAEDALDRLPATRTTFTAAVELMEWLIEHGGVAERHAARLTAAAQHPRRLMNPRALRLLWRHQGASASALILEHLPAYLTDDVFGPPACALLADMGSLARPAVPALEAVVHRRTRISMHIGDEDAELRADEHLAAVAAAALEQLV